ncbi:PepSY domain-containing protein [Streptomyces sp. URMC 123]|uniref:PepSY domain-containing protein n=1 Tax=Streptomyces sp. URMC 123 TaxID=3423403 RepID=UPI003F1AEE07
MARRGRTAAVLCAAAVAAALVTGCGDDGGNGGATTPPPVATPPTVASEPAGSPSPGGSPDGSPGTQGLTQDQADRKALIPAAKVKYGQAADTAVGKVPGGKLVEAELKRADGGAPQWRTKVAAQDGTVHEVRIDAVSGQVSHSQVEAGQDAEDKRKITDRLGKATLSPQRAADIATGRKEGTVSSVKLDDTDDGTLVWSVDVVTTNDWNKTTFDVGAADGNVLREHVDRD